MTRISLKELTANTEALDQFGTVILEVEGGLSICFPCGVDSKLGEVEQGKLTPHHNPIMICGLRQLICFFFIGTS